MTGDVMDRVQTGYGIAIRNNLPDVNATSTATKAIFYHSVMP